MVEQIIDILEVVLPDQEVLEEVELELLMELLELELQTQVLVAVAVLMEVVMVRLLPEEVELLF